MNARKKRAFLFTICDAEQEMETKAIYQYIQAFLLLIKERQRKEVEPEEEVEEVKVNAMMDSLRMNYAFSENGDR